MRLIYFRLYLIVVIALVLLREMTLQSNIKRHASLPTKLNKASSYHNNTFFYQSQWYYYIFYFFENFLSHLNLKNQLLTYINKGTCSFSNQPTSQLEFFENFLSYLNLKNQLLKYINKGTCSFSNQPPRWWWRWWFHSSIYEAQKRAKTKERLRNPSLDSKANLRTDALSLSIVSIVSRNQHSSPLYPYC